MNNIGQVKPPGSAKSTQSQATNPFARALAEQENSTYGKKQGGDSSSDLFSEALSKTGGNFPADFNPEQLLQQQADLEKQRKKAEMRQKLHDQVNPVDQMEVFNAEKVRTKNELEEVRKELKALAVEIKKFYKEVDIQTTQTVVDQGMQGTGLKSYFQKLRNFIILLTQQVKSQRTWLQQQKAKGKRRKIKGGIDMAGHGSQESKAVFDMMHHERSTAYSGA